MFALGAELADLLVFGVAVGLDFVLAPRFVLLHSDAHFIAVLLLLHLFILLLLGVSHLFYFELGQSSVRLRLLFLQLFLAQKLVLFVLLRHQHHFLRFLIGHSLCLHSLRPPSHLELL